MSENIPEKMLKNMSNKMSEGLPIIKYINIIVGIIQNIYIF